ATPVFWGPDYRWKELLRIAFDTHANTVIAPPLIVLGLMKLAKATETPLYIFDVIAGGDPFPRWIVNDLKKGFDCNTWGCYAINSGPVVAGFSCTQEAGIHIREEVIRPHLVRDSGEKSAPNWGKLYFTSAKNPDLIYDPEQDALLQSFQAKKQGARFWEKQKINIATTSAVTNVILPDIVAELISKQSLPDIRMSVMDNLDELLRKIETKESDIGLATVRTKLLPGKIAQYADIFDVEILMHDNFVVTMNKRFYHSCDTCIDAKMYGNALVKTSYDILSLDDEFTEKRYNANIICSNDADFHRSMMDKTGAMTMMSGLAYRFYFNNKKYIALPYEDESFSLVHVAICRRDASPQIREFVAMIRREMYMK
ncbi:MAG: hypothetical protein II211_06145, partial [Peptococcaceae bacterium]|nr:hypothetical protein [Peptococcaceae bacterium]